MEVVFDNSDVTIMSVNAPKGARLPLRGVLRFIGTVECKELEEFTPVYTITYNETEPYQIYVTESVEPINCRHGAVSLSRHGETEIIGFGPNALLEIQKEDGRNQILVFKDGEQKSVLYAKLLALGLIQSATLDRPEALKAISVNVPQLSEAAEAAFKQL